MRDDIDVIDICTSNAIHMPIAVAAAQTGKHIICEKSVAMNAAEARAMVDAAQTAGIHHMVAFNYRRVPAIALARQMINEGKIGRVFHFNAVYYQDWLVGLLERSGSRPNGLDRFRSGGPVPQRTVRPRPIIIESPSFDMHLCLEKGIEYFAVEQLVTQLAIERLDRAVFPGTSNSYPFSTVLLSHFWDLKTLAFQATTSVCCLG